MTQSLSLNTLVSSYQTFDKLAGDKKVREKWLGEHFLYNDGDIKDKPVRLKFLSRCCITKWIYLKVNKLDKKKLEINKINNLFESTLKVYQTKLLSFSSKLKERNNATAENLKDPKYVPGLLKKRRALFEELGNLITEGTQLSQAMLMANEFLCYKYRNGTKGSSKVHEENLKVKTTVDNSIKSLRIAAKEFSSAGQLVQSFQLQEKDTLPNEEIKTVFLNAIRQFTDSGKLENQDCLTINDSMAFFNSQQKIQMAFIAANSPAKT